MSRRIHRLGLLLACLIASEVWALGLGDIRLSSALNEPLDAEIVLLSATQEELDNLKIALASAETFDRYGIDRPNFLQSLDFTVTRSGAGGVIAVTSREPITEPFVTFLIEAEWSRGKLLREYTVLLDPPTFAPPPPTPTTEAVTAPQETRSADRGRIERPAPPPPAPRSAPPVRQTSPMPAPAEPVTQPAPARPAPQPAATTPAVDTSGGSEYDVQRGDTLWRIAERVRPDPRLSMNQTMLAIYEANPRAFAGNINVLRANSRLRVPSADEIFRISRGSALSEVRRQNQSWRGDAPSAPQPTLTLVPPDDAPQQEAARARSAPDVDSSRTPAPAASRADQSRIQDLESRVAEQESLLEIRDSELARLRSELQRLREERAERAAAAGDDSAAPDSVFIDDEPEVPAVGEEPAVTAEPAPVVEPATPAPRVVSTPRQEEQGIVGTILGFLTSIWGLIGIALLAVVGVLVWFARRASGTAGDAEDTGVWESLGPDAEADPESIASTQRLRALARDDETSIMVVEQPGGDTIASESTELPGVDMPPKAQEPAAPVSIDDTFSSETAINLDKSDPIAEADFHMAYGLYDQAADLVDGAVAVEPERTDLKAKLCEIYFVWGNRDKFIEASNTLQASLGPDETSEWDKVVIMGQQLAPDDPLFADASPSRIVQTVDLDFEDAGGKTGSLDIDFEGSDGLDEIDNDASVIIDLGAEEFDEPEGTRGGMLDFDIDDVPDTAASATREMPKDFGKDDDATAESPTIEQSLDDVDDTAQTAESPTLEQPLGGVDGTTELPAISDDVDARLSGLDSGAQGDATAEIDISDLGLDLGTMRGDDAGGEGVDLDATSESRALDDTGTARLPGTDDNDLMEATGLTQVLSDDVIKAAKDSQSELGDDDATLLAPGAGGSAGPADFDFAETESLPSGTFKEDDSSDDTAESPLLATEMNLDLDDLTAALKVSETGDTVEQARDEKTVEQPLLSEDASDADVGLDLGDVTQEISTGDDLGEARTMTEVGTKLDLARAYVDMGDPGGARNILEEVLEEGDEGQRQQAQQLLDSLPS
ncbi:MAG: LysM peptidoglycan-binding domain-containing protein [Woeseia sp.]|nr:LysM peptidoglycan-binding domain-containing protein [Woeseia sp.]MBT8095548.1 LysM peptidoglycan-binding domain-containing protein [Woeseia sp.]NNE59844.1 LysM peptidoglycan-binding domain-containing protein [Woeseia sp.]NNL55873.1 LysM peptidoglycan-binding domain-containing protein [Woeseia sp.]